MVYTLSEIIVKHVGIKQARQELPDLIDRAEAGVGDCYHSPGKGSSEAHSCAEAREVAAVAHRVFERESAAPNTAVFAGVRENEMVDESALMAIPASGRLYCPEAAQRSAEKALRQSRLRSSAF